MHEQVYQIAGKWLVGSNLQKSWNEHRSQCNPHFAQGNRKKLEGLSRSRKETELMPAGLIKRLLHEIWVTSILEKQTNQGGDGETSQTLAKTVSLWCT